MLLEPAHRLAVTPVRTPADVREVARLEDRAGILSAFFAPGPWSGDARALRDKLEVLRERARPWRARDRRALDHAAGAVLRRAQEDSDMAAAAVAVYWRLDAGESLELALPAPVACTASVGAQAQLGPLCEAVEACRCAGVLRVDGSLAALYELSGRTASRPRLVARVDPDGGRVRRHGARRGWDLLLVAGDGDAAEALLGAPATRTGAPAVVDARAALADAGAVWAFAAQRIVAAERRRRGLAELEDLAARAACGDHAVSGHAAAARALAAGRVERLVLAVPAPAPPAAPPVPPWPRAAERLLHAAVAAGTELRIVAGAPSPRLPAVAAATR
jgi:hypothetical protein